MRVWRRAQGPTRQKKTRKANAGAEPLKSGGAILFRSPFLAKQKSDKEKKDCFVPRNDVHGHKLKNNTYPDDATQRMLKETRKLTNKKQYLLQFYSTLIFLHPFHLI
jgi:hypothetical protein